MRRRRSYFLKHKRKNYNVNLKIEINWLPEKDVSLSTLATYFTIGIYASIEN